MYKVVYKYDYVERNKGFEVNKIVIKEDYVGEYETVEEAKHHPPLEIEEKYPNGAYVITKVS